MMKRIAVWFIETSSEVLLLGVVLTLQLGHDRHEFLKRCIALRFWNRLAIFQHWLSSNHSGRSSCLERA